MFDTMTVTKVAASLCGALLIFLLGKWVAMEVYHMGSHGGQQAYIIDTGASEEDVAEVDEVPFAEVFAAADAGDGSKVFRKCSGCHKLEVGAVAQGPHLVGVVGRQIAAVDGFGYSGALTGLDAAWTPEELSAFLKSPDAYASGTKMKFKGLSKVEDRANLIAYLATVTP